MYSLDDIRLMFVERCEIFGAISLTVNLMLLLLTSIIILLLFIGVSILLYKIVVDLVKGKRSDWGINFSLPNCPKCGKKVPAIRKPTSNEQAMWGGWTCSNCGCEMDKWGKEINIIENEI